MVSSRHVLGHDQGAQKKVKGHVGRPQPLALFIVLGLTCPLNGGQQREDGQELAERPAGQELLRAHRSDQSPGIRSQTMDVVETVESNNGMSAYIAAQFGEVVRSLQDHPRIWNSKVGRTWKHLRT